MHFTNPQFLRQLRFWLISLSCLAALSSSAFAATQYALLNPIEARGDALTVRADYVDLVTPGAGVSRGAIPASDARHYRRVFSDQNKQLRRLTLSASTRVTLLTYPNLAPKTASLDTLQQLLENDEALPSEFETLWNQERVFALELNGSVVTSIAHVNPRAVTGVYTQAVLISKPSSFVTGAKLLLDFVEVMTTERDMRRVQQTMEQNPAGILVSNRNPQIRGFTLSATTRIRVLKNALEYRLVTPKQLEAGLNGQDLGWRFDWDTPFEARLSDVTNTVLELRQVYLP
jgi:hypothetical protein